MTKDEARSLVERLVAAYNSKDRAGLAGLYAEDISLWSALGAELRGRDEVLEHIDELFGSLPDELMTVDTLVTDGEATVIEVTSSGTDRAGEPYEIQFTEVLEISNGRFSEIKTYLDPDDVKAIAVGE